MRIVAYRSGANRTGHVLPTQKNSETFRMGDQSDIGAAGYLQQGGFIFKVHLPTECLEGNRPVCRAGVEISNP